MERKDVWENIRRETWLQVIDSNRRSLLEIFIYWNLITKIQIKIGAYPNLVTTKWYIFLESMTRKCPKNKMVKKNGRCFFYQQKIETLVGSLSKRVRNHV